MFVRLTRGNYALDLAGETPQSETVGFSHDAQGTFQTAQYIEADQASQFYRGGAFANISFDSRLEFASVADAQAYLLATPQGLISQASQTVTIGTLSASGTKQVETLTCVGSATGDGNINWSFTDNVLGTITGTTAVLNADTPTLYAAKIAISLSAVAKIRARYAITSSGADVILTKRQSESDDTTLVLTTTNGSPSPNITGATSANTTAGVAPTISSAITINQASVVLNLAQTGVSIARNVTISGKYG